MSVGVKPDSLSISQVSRRLLCVLTLMFTLLSTEKSPVSANTQIFYEQFTTGWTADPQWAFASPTTYQPRIFDEPTQTPRYALRLTSTATKVSGGLIFKRPIPISAGLDVSFTFSQWGGTGADGMSFFLQKGTETSSALPAGGTLGYSADRNQTPNLNGLRNGLIGIGLDMFGNYSSPSFDGTGCPSLPTRPGANALVIRGPGHLMAGYCIVGSLKNTTTNWASGASSTRSGRAKAIRIVVDPNTAASPKIKVWICAANTTCSIAGTPNLSVNAPAALLNEPTVRFGFAAATGGYTNRHEVWDLTVRSQEVFPPVVITTQTLANGGIGTAYSASVAANGVAPYTFAIASGTLPPGLTLNALTGEITGTPTTAGTYNFTIETTDSRVVGEVGRTATQPYTVTIGGALCTVTYDEAGGSTVANTDFLTGETITLPAAPTRAGYSFLGWFTAASGGSPLTSPHTPSGCNIELIAQWSLLYNVTYEERGGTTVSDATFISGGTVTLPPAPTRAGFTFTGWFTAPDGGTQYGSTTTPPDGDVTIYAQWLPYTVTYEERGGTAVSDTTFNCPTTCDTITLPPAPTRAGYVFEGWYTEPTGGTRYGATYVPTAKDQVIYAQWTPYEVSFNTQGGTSVPGYIIGSNATITLPPPPTRAGFTFNGWFTTPTGGSPVGSTYGPHTGDLEFFAQWSPVLHNVTYQEYGGTAVPDATFVSGGTVTLPPDPTRAGYTFDGWFTAQTGGTMYDPTFSPPDGNLVVHAQWTQNPFMVTYEEYGGTTVSDTEFVSGGMITLPSRPTRAGYTFEGWFTAQTGGTKYGSTASPPDGNLVVHAQWTQISANTLFTVTYEEHGGATVPDATFVSGGTVTLPAAPTRAGYTFDGWFTEPSDGTMFGSSFSPSDDNLVVHAQWTPIPFTVTYEEYGGTVVSDDIFISGGIVTLPAAPTRAGYTFNGWFSAQTGGTMFGSSFSPSNGNVVVHAQWTPVAVVTTPAPAPAPAPVVVSAIPAPNPAVPQKAVEVKKRPTAPVLPATGNDIESILLMALALMIAGFFATTMRRTKTR